MAILPAELIFNQPSWKFLTHFCSVSHLSEFITHPREAGKCTLSGHITTQIKSGLGGGGEKRYWGSQLGFITCRQIF